MNEYPQYLTDLIRIYNQRRTVLENRHDSTNEEWSKLNDLQMIVNSYRCEYVNLLHKIEMHVKSLKQ